MKSKYVKDMEVTKLPNQWREIEISEAWLRTSIAFLLQQHRFVRSASEVERIILSDPKNDTYKLTYSVSRRKEE